MRPPSPPGPPGPPTGGPGGPRGFSRTLDIRISWGGPLRLRRVYYLTGLKEPPGVHKGLLRCPQGPRKGPARDWVPRPLAGSLRVPLRAPRGPLAGPPRAPCLPFAGPLRGPCGALVGRSGRPGRPDRASRAGRAGPAGRSAGPARAIPAWPFFPRPRKIKIQKPIPPCKTRPQSGCTPPFGLSIASSSYPTGSSNCLKGTTTTGPQI